MGYEVNTLIMMLALSLTPAECKADPAFCACRRLIAKELNQCQVEASRYIDPYQSRRLTQCLARYEECKTACATNDVELCMPKERK